jgi:S-adenosylmethionine hydrolase
MYVGPDNGLLAIAADADGIDGVRSLTNPHYHLDQVSHTFHARDVFSPVAAHLAAGASFVDLGDEVDPATLVRIDLPVATVVGGELTATVLDVDRFGNLGLNVATTEVDDLGVSPGDTVELSFALTPYYAVVGETYADAARGELILYEDSYGTWAIAINGGNAAALTEAGPGDVVRISPA